MQRTVEDIAKAHDVIALSIFGSFARGDASSTSDIDIIVEFRGDKSLLDLIGLKHALEDALGITADVFTPDSLHPMLKDKIVSESVVVF